MEKGQIVTLTIEDMSGEGQGIGRTEEGLVVFVPDAVPGDVVYAELTKVKKNYAFSKLVQVVEQSEARSEELCPYAKADLPEKASCGGCPFGIMNYDAQLVIKENQVLSKLERLAGISFDSQGPVFNEIIGAAAPYNYRNKAVMPISTGGFITKKGGTQIPEHEPRIGFRPNKSNDVIDCEDCWLQAPTAMAAAAATRQFMEEDHITSYDRRWEKGLMHGMTVKTAFGTGEVMVIYDINGKGIPGAAKLIGYLDEAIYDAGGSLESVVIRTSKDNKIKVETLAGKPVITDTVEIDTADGIREYSFEISAGSFYQVNPVQMQNLYGVVRDYCERAAWSSMKKPVVLDLYCGIGTIGLCMADLAEHVHGIEIVKEAVIDANRNATINGIVNATYECGRAEELIPKWLEAGNLADVAIIDPPRAGCKPELLSAIAKAGLPHIIYVSCDPATLARDIKLLREGAAGNEGDRYDVVEVTPVDMFPHTSHVETVCLLSKKNNDVT